MSVTKLELLARLRDLAERVAGSYVPSEDMVDDAKVVEAHVVALENTVAVAIDKVMAGRYARHNHSVLIANAPRDQYGLSGQWRTPTRARQID
jgi:hypothetical protein